jgi:2-polyprenyl-3-methyl-5-hydroxy-6-metoxy-1,4-benzoquinol methylase
MAARCRICERELFDRPLARYANMPRVAQFLPDASNLDADRGLDLVVCQCSGCGLVQLNSEPVHYYKDVIRAAGLSPEMRAFREAQFGGFVSRFSLAGKKAIEIGCGRGEYLSVLDAAGVIAHGLEHAADSVAACVANGLRVTRGFVEKADHALPDAPYDAFMILNFLEHLPHPNAMLRGIRNNLCDGGVGIVEVPNFDVILRERQFAEFMSDHLLYFTAGTLTTALTINGFDVLECTEQFHGYLLSAVVRKRGPVDLSAFHTQQARQRDDLHAYIHRFGPRRVAIWGAGHQALAIMALLDLGGSIRYVVDSAPFKQGKFTPATHIPIVPPETLQSDPVDAVIVIAGGYSDEVARMVRAKYDRNLKVAIWRESGLEHA